jgi:hypothetical protein
MRTNLMFSMLVILSLQLIKINSELVHMFLIGGAVFTNVNFGSNVHLHIYDEIICSLLADSLKYV